MDTTLFSKLCTELPYTGLVIFVVWFLVKTFLAHDKEKTSVFMNRFDELHEENISARKESSRVSELRSVSELEMAKAISALSEAVRSFKHND